MRMFIALYIKEIKDVRGVFCILGIGTLVLQGWVLLAVETQMIALFLSGLPLWAIMFALPFLLASSFNGEWRGNTNHLLFALPIRAGVMGLCKFAAILSIGLLLFAIAGTGVYFVVSSCCSRSRVQAYTSSARPPGSRFPDSEHFRRHASGGFRIRRGILRFLCAPVAWRRDSHGGRQVHGLASQRFGRGGFICFVRCHLSDDGGLLRRRNAGISVNWRGINGLHGSRRPGLSADRAVPV